MCGASRRSSRTSRTSPTWSPRTALALLGIVGDNLHADPGTFARIVGALGPVPLKLVSQAASRRNVTIVLPEAELAGAVARLHGVFFGDAASRAAPCRRRCAWPARREPDMDLRQLEILRAVAESGSFTGAGRRLHVSQSAVSRQILLLEAELNEPLFWRIKRKVRITPTGEALLQLAIRVFQDIKETTASITETQEKLTGSVRLVGGMTVSLYVFPALLKEFRRQHPEVDVRVITGSTERLLRKLRSGAADLGLITLPIDEPDLVTVPVMREELMLVTYPSHPLAKRARVEPQDLVRQPFILYEPGSNTRRVIDEFFLREPIRPRMVMETENVEIIKAMVRSGLGITVISHQAVEREVREGELASCRIGGSDAGARDRVGIPQVEPRPAQDRGDDPRPREDAPARARRHPRRG